MEQTLVDNLHALLGRSLSYEGEACVVVELLLAENALVLQYNNRQQTIQANQFGEANRRANSYHTLPLLLDGSTLNPVVAVWISEQDQ